MKIRLKKDWDRGRRGIVPAGREIEVQNVAARDLIKKKIAEPLDEVESQVFEKKVKEKLEEAENKE